MKVIALQRNREETIKSFEQIKGVGKGSINHWSDHNGKDWSRNIWDECYPKYDLSDRYAAIGRYWDEYYAAVERWQKNKPHNVLIASMDILNSEEGQDKLFDFLGIDEHVHSLNCKYNVNTVADGVRLWG